MIDIYKKFNIYYLIKSRKIQKFLSKMCEKICQLRIEVIGAEGIFGAEDLEPYSVVIPYPILGTRQPTAGMGRYKEIWAFAFIRGN